LRPLAVSQTRHRLQKRGHMSSTGKPGDSQALLVSTHLMVGFFAMIDVPARSSLHGWETRQRRASNPWHLQHALCESAPMRPNYCRPRFHLRGNGCFIRFAQGSQPEVRPGYGVIDCGLHPIAFSMMLNAIAAQPCARKAAFLSIVEQTISAKLGDCCTHPPPPDSWARIGFGVPNTKYFGEVAFSTSAAGCKERFLPDFGYLACTSEALQRDDQPYGILLPAVSKQ